MLLSSPSNPYMSHIMEAKILLSREKKYWCYSIGDRVEGKLVVHNSQPLNCSGICVSLETTVRVNFKDSDGRIKTHTENVMSPNVSTYVWPNNWNWAQITGKLNDDRQMCLRASKHVFPFSFEYPLSPLPGSFCSEYGSVKHQVVAYVKTPSSFRRIAVHLLSFGDYLNLFQDAYSLKPLRFEKRKKSLFSLIHSTSSSPLQFSLKMTQRGFLPGEYAPFTLTLLNFTGKAVSRILVSLIQKVSYHTIKSKKTLGNVLDETDTSEADLAMETIWESGFYIPNAVKPTFFRGIIQHQYFIKVQVFSNGTTNRPSLKGHVPIVIGTVREPPGCLRSCIECQQASSTSVSRRSRNRRASMELPLRSSWDPLFGSDDISEISPPPSYSQLSSRATSIDSFLPQYEEAMIGKPEVKIRVDRMLQSSSISSRTISNSLEADQIGESSTEISD